MNDLLKKYVPAVGLFIFPNLRREVLDSATYEPNVLFPPAHLLVTATYATQADTLFKSASCLTDVITTMRRLAKYENLPAEPMVEGKTYATNIRVLKVIRNPDYTIRIDRLSHKDRVMISQEGNRRVRSWRHKLEVTPSGTGAIWTDLLEIDAGLMTPLVSWFARFMYLHRHKERGALSARAVLGEKAIRTFLEKSESNA